MTMGTSILSMTPNLNREWTMTDYMIGYRDSLIGLDFNPYSSIHYRAGYRDGARVRAAGGA
jgi:hypothetical protein